MEEALLTVWLKKYEFDCFGPELNIGVDDLSPRTWSPQTSRSLADKLLPSSDKAFDSGPLMRTL